MAQIFLDPRSAPPLSETSPAWTPNGPIPPALREFGYCIDFASLNAGDLILFSSITPGLIPRSIRRVQLRGGYDEEDARWEHAAVYIGSEKICEATRHGVNVKPIYGYIGSHLIRVRRNLLLTTDEGWRLAIESLQLRNYRYGFFSILELYFKSRHGFWQGEGKPVSFPKSSVYCSELYADAHVKICNTALGNKKSGEITPASLSLDLALRDVPLSWIKIAQP